MSASNDLEIPLRYCRDKMGGTGSVSYYSLLFLPPASRAALTALHALHRELDDIADECADPGVAQLKFAWWRQELADMRQGQARHPVTRLLTPALPRLTASPQAFDEMLDAATARLPPQRYANFDELREHARRVGGPVAVLSATLLGGNPIAARALGAALTLTDGVCGLGGHARHDRIPLPLDDLTRFDVPLADVLQGKEDESFYRLMAFEVDRADSLLRESLQAIVPGDRRALLPLRVQAQIALATLAAVRRKGYTVLQRRPTLAPLHMLWIAWRTNRTTGPSVGPA